ncbi:MAG: hypothetical protein ACREOU_13540 [Candidatus Eiseniibacteriota bacterium]
MSQIVFLLSPAHSGGKRAQWLVDPQASFPLAIRLRRGGIPLGEAMSFMSGLYFRGKLAYASTFERSPRGRSGVLVIVPGRGLVPAQRRVSVRDLREIASIGVNADDPGFRNPLARDARALANRLGEDGLAVLLGSIASDKYVGVLDRILGGRLCFPSDFVGRGDMSRGGLLLRCVREGRELEYVPVHGAIRRGPRPRRLEPVA